MRVQLRTPIRFGDRSDLSSPRGLGPRMGARYDADAFGQISESAARFLGTGRYLVGQTVFVIFWIALNTIGLVNHWDPYPFILLNLAFSTQAAYAAPLILLAQNRQDDRDRASIERDREVAARTHPLDMAGRLEHLGWHIACLEQSAPNHDAGISRIVVAVERLA